MEMEFFMAMEPPTCTHQEKKVTVIHGKPVFYDPPEVKAARAKLMDHLLKHQPEKPIKTGCRLVVKWCFILKRIAKKSLQEKDKKIFYMPEA